MNPDQPSREQIEARLTALLLGELPAAEAELLRWTISRDPELQKLHDQLAATIGFVREAMKNPTGAPTEPGTPLKLPQERRQNLLAHFKTARPELPLVPVLHRRFKVSPLIGVLAVIAIVALLAAMLLPVLETAKMRGYLVNSISSSDEMNLGTATTTSGRQTTKHEVKAPTSQQNAAINNMRTITAAVNEWKLETGQPSGPSNAGETTFTPSQVRIALPNTESSQAASEQYDTNVYSQNVVGYINITPGASSAKQEPAPAQPATPIAELALPSSPSPAPEVEPETASNVRVVEVAPGGSAASSNPESSQAEVETTPPANMASAPPVAMAPAPAQQIPPTPAGGTYNVAGAGNLSQREEQIPPTSAGGGYGGGTTSFGQAPKLEPAPQGQGGTAGSLSERNTANVNNNYGAQKGIIAGPVAGQISNNTLAYSGQPSTANGFQGYSGQRVENGPYENGDFQSGLQNNVQANGANGSPYARELKYRDLSQTTYATNAVAINQFQGRYAWSANDLDQSAPTTRENPNANTAVPYSFGLQLAAPTPLAVGTVGTAGSGPVSRVGLPPRQQQQVWVYHLKNANPSDVATGLEKMGLAGSIGQAGEQSPLATRESQNATTLSDNSQAVTQGPINAPAEINPATGLPQVPAVDSKKKDAATLARDGQMLYEMGKVDEAQLKLQRALELDPDNRGANYYLQLAKQSPYATTDHRRTMDNNDRLVQVERAWEKPVNVTTNFASSVPVIGELFPSSVLRSPQSRRQYVQNEQTLDGDRNIGAPKVPKQADVPMIPAPTPQPGAPIPQPEIQTSDNAFSTFSMNVSDVSFKLAMASLEKGQLPNPASIRSEEFINAFDYHDPEPLQGEPLAFTFERAQDPFAQERDMLRFSIKAAAAGRQDGRALNIVLLLDTSGSMERADRVAIIREALNVLSGQLQPQDVVSVVTFARTARLWADGIPGNEAGATLAQVGSITPEGGTNLEEAMRLAYETALRHFIAGGINRVVLLTDGAANLGNVDPQALTQKVDSERRQGIALDCFGIGWDDYNDDLLEQLSSNGDGRYAFINSPDEAATEFAAKLAGALQVAAEDVKVQVEFNPDRVTAWRQIGYAKHQLTKQQFRDNSVAAGAIAAREAGNALYVIETNPNGQGPIATVRVRYRMPGTQTNYEKSWLVDYTGDAPELAQSSPAMRLAVTAAEISEWMADSPFAQEVTPDELRNYLSGVPQFYSNDDRPKQLENMIREADALKR